MTKANNYLSARLDELKEKLIDSIVDFSNRLISEIEDLIETLKQLPINEAPATSRQLEFLKNLYVRLKRPIPPDLDLLTKRQASQEIDKLLNELRRK